LKKTPRGPVTPQNNGNGIVNQCGNNTVNEGNQAKVGKYGEKNNIENNNKNEQNNNQKSVAIVNTHLFWDPLSPDIKLWQSLQLCQYIQRYYPTTSTVPVIICGDLNSLPSSHVYNFLLFQKVTSNFRNEIDNMYNVLPQQRNYIKHNLKLQSAYSSILGYEPVYTNWSDKFKGTLDYILYSSSSSSLQCTHVLLGYPNGDYNNNVNINNNPDVDNTNNTNNTNNNNNGVENVNSNNNYSNIINNSFDNNNNNNNKSNTIGSNSSNLDDCNGNNDFYSTPPSQPLLQPRSGSAGQQSNLNNVNNPNNPNNPNVVNNVNLINQAQSTTTTTTTTTATVTPTTPNPTMAAMAPSIYPPSYGRNTPPLPPQYLTSGILPSIYSPSDHIPLVACFKF
jgi:hypothetical protein